MDAYPKILKDYLNYMKTIKGSSKLTVKEYGYDINNYLKFIKHISSDNSITSDDLNKIVFEQGDIPLLESVSLQDLYSYLAYLDNVKNNSSRTRSRKISSIRSFYDYIYNKSRQINANPTDKLELPKSSKTNPVYLTLSESMDLLNTILEEENNFIRTRDYAMVTIFLNVGLRLSELRGINLSNIKENKLTVLGKGNKERTIFLNKACQNAINDYLIYRPELENEDALFLSFRNNRISVRSIQSRVEKYIKKIGLDSSLYSVHKLRHTAATLMYKYGKTDIRTLQSILGHESVATTQIYTHINSEDMQNALDNNPLNHIDNN